MGNFEKLHILGAWRITLPSFTDERGSFQEIIHNVKYPSEIQPEAGIYFIQRTRHVERDAFIKIQQTCHCNSWENI